LKIVLAIAAILFCHAAICQQETNLQTNGIIEQQLETLAEQEDGETEDDSYLQVLDEFRKNRMNLNTAEESDLKELELLSDLQIENFLSYRRLLGNLISLYELQAIPTWDVVTIRRLLPYIKVTNAEPIVADLKRRFSKGEQTALIRMQQVVEKSKGFVPDSNSTKYVGSPQRMFFRYKYNYRNLLQFGLTGDKDAGEQFFKGTQKQGFDFYSFHVFTRKLGFIKSLALGDFTVNLGQGLINWQTLGFKMSTDITGVKRQSEVLRPYNSAGEFKFMRGAGITVGGTNVSFTTFASFRKLDASVHSDSLNLGHDYVSSILTTGYHRSVSEISEKNAITETSFGGNISYRNKGFHAGINSVAFKLSTPLIRNIVLYNQFQVQGNDWYNCSFDYSYTYRNYHFFGEAAMDKNNSKAFIGGMLASLDERVDLSLVYRNIAKTYQSFYGNAFTENTLPSNEKGLFLGLSIKPSTILKIDAYSDVFSFPWLKYRVDAPSKGTEYLLQLSYRPGKRLQVITRFKSESKAINITDPNVVISQIATKPKQNWRTDCSYNVSRTLNYTQRVEVVWYDSSDKAEAQKGLLTFIEASLKPSRKPFIINGRVQYFSTDGFDSRIYSFESDVLYSYSVPAFAGKGVRYYINLNLQAGKRTNVWLRWGQTLFSNQTSIGSGLDAIAGNKKTEVKLQLLYSF
jgi:hypothetical protein